MSIDTTTSDPISPAAEEPQLDEVGAQTGAVAENEDTSQTSESENAESSTEDDSEVTELKEWAAKKNLPLDDPIKLARMYRESEQKLGKKGQQEGQLKAAVTSANSESGVDDIQALRNEVTALNFYMQHPEARQYEADMVSILEEKPWLANDLDIVLAAAKGNSESEAAKLAAERKAGKKEGLAAAEKAGRAAPPRASATNTDTESTRITPSNVDEVIGQHMGDAKWYKAHEAEINRALAG